MGKHKPIYDQSTDCGDYVVATGCHELHTTGKKRFQKKYYTHSTRPGSLKEITMDRMFAKWGGAEVLRKAVSGMLPKNRLRKGRLARLKGEFGRFPGVGGGMIADGLGTAFEGAAHPYKENIIKVSRTRIGELPEVKATLAKAVKAPSAAA
jgi:large subunit ribosomal protein L13